MDITDPAHPRALGAGLTGHTDPVSAAAVSSDGTLLGVTDRAGTAIFWDISDPAEPRRIGDPLAPHGSTAAFPIAFPHQPGSWRPPASAGGVPVGHRQPGSPRQLGPGMSDNLDAAFHLAFSADDTVLASAGSDGDFVLWDLTPFHDLRRDPVDTACEITDRGLDREQWTRNVPGLPYQDTCS